MKNERKERANAEIACLSKSFKALTIINQKSVLKTARELLKIQKKNNAITEDNVRYFDSLTKVKNG